MYFTCNKTVNQEEISSFLVFFVKKLWSLPKRWNNALFRHKDRHVCHVLCRVSALFPVFRHKTRYRCHVLCHFKHRKGAAPYGTAPFPIWNIISKMAFYISIFPLSSLILILYLPYPHQRYQYEFHLDRPGSHPRRKKHKLLQTQHPHYFPGRPPLCRR